MTYFEFREVVLTELRRKSAGLTWRELKEGAGLPYRTACPEWVRRLEREDGLRREKGTGRALVWRLHL